MPQRRRFSAGSAATRKTRLGPGGYTDRQMFLNRVTQQGMRQCRRQIARTLSLGKAMAQRASAGFAALALLGLSHLAVAQEVDRLSKTTIAAYRPRISEW
jgi:anti-sigma factor RsiW